LTHNDTFGKVAVLGAGSWGTALSVLIQRNGYRVSLWAHLREEAEALRRDRQNKTYLPGIELAQGITPESDLNAAVSGATEIIIVVPSHAFTAVSEQTAALHKPYQGISWATKGFAPGGGRLLHEVAREKFGRADLAVISGPSFAGEVARGLPTAVTVAATSPEHAKRVAGLLHGERFRAYTSGDMIGVQVGGAAKNVLAIATGIADGLGFGANTRAALITRGLAEITRLGVALGGQAETFMGLAGLGDLVLTCTDDQSRNRRMGLALARGLTVDEARTEIGQEVEGINTARELIRLANRTNTEMPISEQVHAVLFEGLSPVQATENLLERESRAEFC